MSMNQQNEENDIEDENDNQNPELEQSLLELLKEPGYRPVKPRKIVKQLHLAEEQLKQLKRLIKRLVREGKLAYGDKHVVGLAGSGHANRLTGIFRRMKDGFGFVRPDGPATSRDRSDDIYISAAKAGDAASKFIIWVWINGVHDDRRPKLGALNLVFRALGAIHDHHAIDIGQGKRGIGNDWRKGSVFGSNRPADGFLQHG